MARWLVQLQGADAKEFPVDFPTGEIHVFKEVEAIYVTGTDLEQHSEAAEVFGAVNEWLDYSAAVARILDASAERPTLGTVFREQDDGSRAGFSFMSGTATARFKARATLDGATGPTTAQILLAALRGDPFLRNAAMVWSDKSRTWARLYRVLEELESSLEMHVDAAGFCSGADRTRFRRSANTAETAGTDSRHGTGQFKPPGKPMTLGEATKFIGKLFEKTLRKVASTAEAPPKATSTQE